MGIYLNAGYENFLSAVNSEIYIDKTGLLEELNRAIGTENRYFAVSRARRFGKSMVADMIGAYYDCSCDSREIFTPFEIAEKEDFKKHLNQYYVLHFDVSSFFNQAENLSDTVKIMDEALRKDMARELPYLAAEHPKTAANALSLAYQKEKRKFIVIIDEWDCIIRDAKKEEALILKYLRYLRGFFKTTESKQFLALGYITGILPIKIIEGESAMNNFEEYTMIFPGRLAPYFGFMDSELDGLYEKYHMPISEIKNWYDGYLMRYVSRDNVPQTLHIFNPNSLVLAFRNRQVDFYWKNTGAFRTLNTFITRNEAGLKDDIVRLLAGENCPVNVYTFQNDLTSFKRKDDVLTALIHMGYLGYDAETSEAFIPNEEIRMIFRSAIEVGDWTDIQDALDHADCLLKATWAKDGKTVAEMIDASRQDYSSIIKYHDENSLACSIMMSYYTARTHYVIKRELPAGKGFADIVFIPKPTENCPAMVVELKWNRSAKAALKQIRDKNYAGILSDYAGEILLVGINYSKRTGRHTCRIETYQKLE